MRLRITSFAPSGNMIGYDIPLAGSQRALRAPWHLFLNGMRGCSGGGLTQLSQLQRRILTIYAHKPGCRGACGLRLHAGSGRYNPAIAQDAHWHLWSHLALLPRHVLSAVYSVICPLNSPRSLLRVSWTRLAVFGICLGMRVTGVLCSGC